ncbi:MAG: SDR family oxidoreductase [Bacteriovoracaceae bacterium]|nr:SDR family oxidoreductase [Bacteriovoracaceae bacterium]
MKTILITGCSSGFGLQMVEDLLGAGHKVIATLRNASERSHIFNDLIKSYSDNLTIINLDVTNSTDRVFIGKIIKEKFDSKLDVLINNAGVGFFGALEDISENQVIEQMQVNFFGPTFLIKELLPFLRDSKGRVINITSIMGQYSTPLGSVYSASKYALEGLTEGLCYEMSFHGVSVSSVVPGGHRTNFLKAITWGEESQNSNSVYFPITQAFSAFMQKLAARSKAPRSDAVSKAVVQLVDCVKMPREVIVGKDAWSVVILRRLLPMSFYHGVMSKTYKGMLKE